MHFSKESVDNKEISFALALALGLFRLSCLFFDSSSFFSSKVLQQLIVVGVCLAY